MSAVQSAPGLDLPNLLNERIQESYLAAKSRIIAYWVDECARDLGKLMTHFTREAEVITPDGAVRGHTAIASLYQKSFDSYPGLTVHVKTGFIGLGEHGFAYSAILQDAAAVRWLIEGVNLMKLEGGLISSLRSFEDAPRRMPAEGRPN